jgi:hypothetical protein
MSTAAQIYLAADSPEPKYAWCFHTRAVPERCSRYFCVSSSEAREEIALLLAANHYPKYQRFPLKVLVKAANGPAVAHPLAPAAAHYLSAFLPRISSSEPS